MRTHLQSGMLNSLWAAPYSGTHDVGCVGNNYSADYRSDNKNVVAPYPPAYTSAGTSDFLLFAVAPNGNQGGFNVVEPDTYEMQIQGVSGWAAFNYGSLSTWRSQETLYSATGVAATFIGPGTAQYTIKIRRIADAVELGAVTFRLYSAT